MKDIRKDKLYELEVYDGEQEVTVMVNARYDRIDHYEPLDIWILKVSDDEHGMLEGILTEQQARKIAKFALLPIVERDFLYWSEYNMHNDSIAERLDQIWGE